MGARNKKGKFRRMYSTKDVVIYLKGVAKAIDGPPVYRDLMNFPGPSPTTIIRKFKGSWSNALRAAGLRPRTHQLNKEEKKFIKKIWVKMSDQEIAKKLDIPPYIIRYYRLNSRLWKNSRTGDAKSSQKRKAIKLYGENCEACNMPIVEIHHIVSRKNHPDYWCVLCPLCHSVITRKLIKIDNRQQIKTKLIPFMRKIYKSLKI